jgi:hypothetical protein
MKQPAEKKKVRTFSLHWGSGVIEEEVQIETEHHRPTIQLLRFTEGPIAGSYEIRFCYYDRRGRFQRSPMILDAEHVAQMKAELKRAPKLRRLLKKLIA